MPGTSPGSYLCPSSRTGNSALLSPCALPERRQLGTHLLPMIGNNYQVRLLSTKNLISLACPNTASTKNLLFSNSNFLPAMQINEIYNTPSVTPVHFSCFVCSPWSEFSHPNDKAVKTINVQVSFQKNGAPLLTNKVPYGFPSWIWDFLLKSQNAFST